MCSYEIGAFWSGLYLYFVSSGSDLWNQHSSRNAQGHFSYLSKAKICSETLCRRWINAPHHQSSLIIFNRLSWSLDLVLSNQVGFFKRDKVSRALPRSGTSRIGAEVHFFSCAMSAVHFLRIVNSSMQRRVNWTMQFVNSKMHRDDATARLLSLHK